MPIFVALLVASLWGGDASAQNVDTVQRVDTAQRNDWASLQTLSKRFEEFRQCPPSNEAKAEWDKYWRAYDKQASELVLEIESYVKKYTDRRGQDESPKTFTYRVWELTLKNGRDDARKLSSAQCSDLRMAIP